MPASKKRTVVFKDPGGSVTIGGQRFHPGNITPEIADELVKINPAHGDLFDIVEADADQSKTEGGKKEKAESAKPQP